MGARFWSAVGNDVEAKLGDEVGRCLAGIPDIPSNVVEACVAGIDVAKYGSIACVWLTLVGRHDEVLSILMLGLHELTVLVLRC